MRSHVCFGLLSAPLIIILALPESALGCEVKRDIYRLSGQIDQHAEDLAIIRSIAGQCLERLQTAPSDETEQAQAQTAATIDICNKFRDEQNKFTQGKWPYVTENRVSRLIKAAETAELKGCTRTSVDAKKKAIQGLRDVKKTKGEVLETYKSLSKWYAEYTGFVFDQAIKEAIQAHKTQSPDALTQNNDAPSRSQIAPVKTACDVLLTGGWQNTSTNRINRYHKNGTLKIFEGKRLTRTWSWTPKDSNCEQIRLRGNALGTCDVRLTFRNDILSMSGQCSFGNYFKGNFRRVK